MTTPIMTSETTLLNHTLNVKQRLKDLDRWRKIYETEDTRLKHRTTELNPNKSRDIQIGAQIAIRRRQLRLQLVEHPLEIATPHLEHIGYQTLRQNLSTQFAALTRDEQRLWMLNFLFIMTPALRDLDDKVTRVRHHLRLGQQRNFLLGGVSGSGKTTYLDFLAFKHRSRVMTDYNHIPIIKIDAPVSNHTPKPLLQRMILACGLNYLRQDNEEELLMKIALYFQKCHVELLIVDEVEQLQQPKIRRRLLEVSNMTTGIPIICASCSPQHFTEDDQEIAGRWNDYFHLPQYIGDDLRQLLAFIDLLLPFPKTSHLDVYDLSSKNNTVHGPARLIEEYTGGVLRDIMILITDASLRAIEQGHSHISPHLLETTWRSIQTQPIMDILRLFRRKDATLS